MEFKIHKLSEDPKFQQEFNRLHHEGWTHCKNGAKVLTIAPQSMLIKGTIAEWEQWAKMQFPETGIYIVPGALTPVQIDCESNIGQYIEPNVWVQHEL